MAGKWHPAKALMVLSKNWWDEYQSADMYYEHPEEAIQAEVPAISTIRCYKGKEFAKAFIVTILTDFFASYSVGKGTSSSQVYMAAERIYKRWYWIKVSDFKFVLSRARRTMKAYDSMDSVKVEQLLEEYDRERTEISAAKQLSDSAYMKATSHIEDLTISEWERERIRKLSEGMREAMGLMMKKR